MSYSILYRAMYVKLSDGSYIPMAESGDNNVYEFDNRRRAREWSSCRWGAETPEQRSRYSLSEDEILAVAQKVVDDIVVSHDGQKDPFSTRVYTRDEVLKNFTYFSCLTLYGRGTISAAQFLNFVKSGFRNAVTFDDLKQKGCRLVLTWWSDCGMERDFVGTEEELADRWAFHRNAGRTLYVGLEKYPSERLWDMVVERNRKEPRERAVSSEGFVITFTLYGNRKYVKKVTARHLSYVTEARFAHRYSSYRSAEKAGARLPQRFSAVADVAVERVAI